MHVGSMLRSARRAAGLTQAEVAAGAGTTQPAIATYESGGKTPSIGTLERLLAACGHELVLEGRPRIRRGAMSLREIAEQMREELSGEQEPAPQRQRDALRLLFAFADDFRGSSPPGKAALIAQEPPLTGRSRFDAALAATAELFAREAAIAAPAWVDEPSRFLESWWFPSGNPAFDAYTLAHTPAVFARHGVFIAREVFDRV